MMNTMRARSIMLLGIVLAVAALLAACGGNQPATPTPTTATTALPPTATATQQPTATPVPTLTPSPAAASSPTATATPRPTVTATPPAATPTAVLPTATPVPLTPTSAGPTLDKTLDNLGSVSMDLQGPPVLSNIEGLDTGNISLPDAIVSVPDLNLDLNYDAIYNVTAPTIPTMPTFPQIPGMSGIPGMPTITGMPGITGGQ